jgi:hypothetical protein
MVAFFGSLSWHIATVRHAFVEVVSDILCSSEGATCRRIARHAKRIVREAICPMNSKLSTYRSLADRETRGSWGSHSNPRRAHLRGRFDTRRRHASQHMPKCPLPVMSIALGQARDVVIWPLNPGLVVTVQGALGHKVRASARKLIEDYRGDVLALRVRYARSSAPRPGSVSGIQTKGTRNALSQSAKADGQRSSN